MNTFPALITRERWEHPAFWVVPAAFAGFILLSALMVVATVVYQGFGFPSADIREFASEAFSLETEDRRQLLRMGLLTLAVPFNVFLVGLMFFYALGSLYDDRRDRSILFWKSLPVSDVETVLSKFATALVLAPLMTFAVIAVVHVLAMLIAAGILLAAGADGWYLVFSPYAVAYAWATLLWGLFAQSLVFMPFVAWLMLASAWAKKAPFLWAVVPPAAVMMLEAWFFRDSHLALWIGNRIDKALPLAFQVSDGGFSVRAHGEEVFVEGALQMRFDLLWSFELWSGVAISAVLLIGAIWLRRYRAEAE